MSEIMAQLSRASLSELCLAERPLTMNFLSVLYIHFTSCCIGVLSVLYSILDAQVYLIFLKRPPCEAGAWSLGQSVVITQHGSPGVTPRHLLVPSPVTLAFLHARTHAPSHAAHVMSTETCPNHGPHQCRLHRGCGAPISRLLTFSENASCYFYHVQVDQTSSAFTTLKL